MQRAEAIELAKALAAQGLHVFPLGPDKRPIIPSKEEGGNGHNDATTDPEQIERLFNKAWTYNQNLNVGIHPGPSGFVAVDLDMKDGKDGIQSWQEAGGTLEAPATTTPSGGLHLWYRQPEETIGTRNGCLEGVDIKGWGGYVVAPGSKIATGEYVLTGNIANAPQLPPQVLPLLPGHRVKRVDRFDESEHTEENLATYRRLVELGGLEPKTVVKDGFNTIELRHAGHLKGTSVSIGFAGDGAAMFFTPNWKVPGKDYSFYEFGIESGRREAWSLDEINRYVNTGKKEFQLKKSEGVEHVRQEYKKGLWDRALSLEEIENLEPPKWLVDGLLQRNSIAFLTADPNVGKTFLAIDWAMHIVAGNEWQGRKVEKGKVLYVAAEGSSGFGHRAKAWKQEFSHEPKDVRDGWTLFKEAVYLDDQKVVEEFIEGLKSRQFDLIVFDTYSMCAPRADTDSGGPDAKIIMDHLRQIKEASGACVLCIDHPGKQDKRSIRGSVTQQGVVDTHIYLDGKPQQQVFTVENTKQRNGELCSSFNLRREKVYLLDENVSSCIIVAASGAEKVTAVKASVPTPVINACLSLRKTGTRKGETVSEWLAQCQIDGVTKGRTYLDKLRKAALDAKLVEEVSAGRFRTTELFEQMVEKESITVSFSAKEANA